MSRRGRSRRRKSYLPLWPRLTILGLVLSVSSLLIGLFAGLEPPPPVGELLAGTVLAARPASDGRPAAALVRIEPSDGPVICGIDRAAFPGRRLPEPGTQIMVDYTPPDCALAPESEEMSRGAFLTLGGGGLALLAGYLWLVGPITRGRFYDAWARGYLGGSAR